MTVTLRPAGVTARFGRRPFADFGEIAALIEDNEPAGLFAQTSQITIKLIQTARQGLGTIVAPDLEFNAQPHSTIAQKQVHTVAAFAPSSGKAVPTSIETITSISPRTQSVGAPIRAWPPSCRSAAGRGQQNRTAAPSPGACSDRLGSTGRPC